MVGVVSVYVGTGDLTSIGLALSYLSVMLICLSKEKVEDEYIALLRTRTVCGIVAFAFIAKMLYYIIESLMVHFGSIAVLGYIAHINFLTNILPLAIIYIIIFKLSLFVETIKIKKSNG